MNNIFIFLKIVYAVTLKNNHILYIPLGIRFNMSSTSTTVATAAAVVMMMTTTMIRSETSYDA